jgi:adenylyltransferase/sulfurtransferase
VFDIVEHALDPDALRRDLLDDAAGGLVVFEGLVRDHNDGRAVSGLEYEIYPAMAIREAEKIFAEAREKFDVIRLRGAHRSGSLGIGEMAVWVGASGRHREDAFRACRYLIDEIKHRLPVWKKEHYVEGPSAWVDCQGCGHQEPSVSEEQYYSRQMSLPAIGIAGQGKLKEARVLVVGAGGLGCPALAALTGAGVGRLTICDGDRLDVSNLHRQTLYRHQDLGRNKAELAARRLADLNPLITITARAEFLGTQNAADLVGDHDVVLDCTDNFSAKYLLHDVCFLQRKVLVQAGIYQYEGQLQVFDFRGDTDAGCLRCTWPDLPAPGCVDSCADAGVLGAVPAVLGGMQAMEAVKMITGLDTPATGATVLVDLLSLATTSIRRPRQPDCPLCGRRPRVRSIIPDEYGEHLDFEISLEGFLALDPGGLIVDIREDYERRDLPPDQAAWGHIPLSDRARWSAFKSGQDVLLVCQHGIRSRVLTEALRAAGHDRVWSLWRGVVGL